MERRKVERGKDGRWEDAKGKVVRSGSGRVVGVVRVVEGRGNQGGKCAMPNTEEQAAQVGKHDVILRPASLRQKYILLTW